MEMIDKRRLRWVCAHEMEARAPNLPLPDDIDRAALGDEAFFVTLPIAAAGARSRNGRTYTRAAVEMLVAQINANRPEGMWGHLSEAELLTRYHPPAVRWLTAMLDTRGVAWAKGLPLTDAARDHFRLAAATGARVGTSITAWATLDGDQVTALELISVDLADPARVGVAVTAAHPRLTVETRTSLTPDPAPFLKREEGSGEKDGALLDGGEDNAVFVHKDPAPPLYLPPLGMERGSGGEGSFSSPPEGEGLGGWVRPAILTETCAALLDLLVEQAVALPAARPLIAERVRASETWRGVGEAVVGGGQRAIDAVGDALRETLAGDDVRSLLRTERIAMMGPPQRRPLREDTAGAAYFRIPRGGS